MADEEGTDGKEGDEKPKVRVIAPIEGLETRAQMAPISITTAISRMCAYHQNIPAVYICAKCQKPMCISCAIPHGHLYLCPQCYQPPQITRIEQQKKEYPKPTLESILGLFGVLIIMVGFFMPWATSEYESPNGNIDESIISGFTISNDYPEVALIFIMAVLIMIVEFILIYLTTSPMMKQGPPIGARLLPMFLGFVAFVVLVNIVLRAESLTSSIHIGWFVCLFGTSIVLLSGVMEIMKAYKGKAE